MRILFAYFGALALMVALTYGHVATAFFVADDFNILNIVANATSLGEATGVAAGWIFFRPLTALTYWVNYLLFGLDPTSFHVFDLLLHALNAFLVAWITWLVVPHRLGAAFAGAAFALLPTATECVTWIAGRFDVLCTTGVLLSIGGWLQFLLRRGGPRAASLTILGLIIALLAKDTGMILPIHLVFLALVPTSETWPTRPWRERWPLLAALVGLFLIYLVVRVSILGGFGGYQADGHSRHLQVDLGNALRFSRDALRLVFAPGLHWGLGILTGGLVATLLVAGFRTLPRRLLPWLVCFGIGLLPTANLAWLDPTTSENTRYLYLPSVFACVALGVAFGRAVALPSARLCLALGALLLGCYGWTVITLNQRWRVAGQTAQTILVQLQTLSKDRDYQYLFIHGLPDSHHGAYIFRNGFETALGLFVSKTLEFPPTGRLSRADWDKYAQERRADPGYHPEGLLLRWLPDQRKLVEP